MVQSNENSTVLQTEMRQENWTENAGTNRESGLVGSKS